MDTSEVDNAIRELFPNSTKVRWTGAKEGSWAGDGKGVIVAYDSQRPYFEGYPANKTAPERGPALCIKLDGDGRVDRDGNPVDRKLDVWVAPHEVERLDVEEATQ